MGQHLSGRRSRRRLASLLLLVQAARLDAHARPAARAAEVPRRDGRRVRASTAPPARRGRGVGDVGRRSSRVDASVSTTAPSTSVTCSSAASASSTCRAIPTGPVSTTSKGPTFHTARWEHQHDLTGKVVAVVGTGSSATQVVPAIQPIVRQLYVFQREPGWVMPKGERDFTDDERAAFANPWRRRQERWRQNVPAGEDPVARAPVPARDQDQPGPRQFCLDYIDRQFADRPELRDAVTPDLPVSRQAARLRQHLLSRAQEGQRGVGAAGRGLGDAAPASSMSMGSDA